MGDKMDVTKLIPKIIEVALGPTGGVFAFGLLVGAGLMYFFVSRHQIRTMRETVVERIEAINRLHDQEIAGMRGEIKRLRDRFEPFEQMVHEAMRAKLSG